MWGFSPADSITVHLQLFDSTETYMFSEPDEPVTQDY